ncbi:MAG: CBS domain-containing protein, partial [Actinocrinis sp.]
APITAVIIIFELTGDYTVILPLMAAIAVAAGVSKLISRDTIYTLKLRRRGIDLDAAAPAALLPGRSLPDVMEPPPAPMLADTPLEKVEQLLADAAHGALPVAESDGAYLGTVTARAAAEALADRQPATTQVRHLAGHGREVTVDTPLREALGALVAADSAGIAVLTADRTRLAGWITHQSLLAALHATHANPSDH